MPCIEEVEIVGVLNEYEMYKLEKIPKESMMGRLHWFVVLNHGRLGRLKLSNHSV